MLENRKFISCFIPSQSYMPTLRLYSRMTWCYLVMMFWALIWIPAGMVLTALTVINNDTVRYYNCLAWALRQWVEKGGYIAIRRSRSSSITWLAWPHFLWVAPEDEQCMNHYVSLKPGEFLLPKLYFEGKVVKGDKENCLDS